MSQGDMREKKEGKTVERFHFTAHVFKFHSTHKVRGTITYLLLILYDYPSKIPL